MSDDQGAVFRALADPTRRQLLDRLRVRNGQTLGELCAGLAMTRQAATQHLALLEAANLVSAIRRGREKLHYLNPAPLHDIGERWIARFERPRLELLHAIKQVAEAASVTEGHMTDRPGYVYVIYIESTPEQVWHALTDADLTGVYWGHRNVSDWRVGSRWEHQRLDGSGIADCVGEVVESVPPHRLVTTWNDPHAVTPPPSGPSRVTFTIDGHGGIVRLTVLHENLPTDEDQRLVALGWPAVLSNLKSLLETGHVLPQQPWTMP